MRVQCAWCDKQVIILKNRKQRSHRVGKKKCVGSGMYPMGHRNSLIKGEKLLYEPHEAHEAHICKPRKLTNMQKLALGWDMKGKL